MFMYYKLKYKGLAVLIKKKKGKNVDSSMMLGVHIKNAQTLLELSAFSTWIHKYRHCVNAILELCYI